MINLQQGVDRKNLSLSNEVNQVNSKGNSQRKELNIWGRKEIKKCEDDGDVQSSQLEFQTEKGDYSAYSPPLWASSSHVNSNLLPHDHHYSSPSPKSRSQLIQNGRKELMEMVQGMPESSYELSLQDIVDDGKRIRDAKQDKDKNIERNNNKSTLKRQISRSQSMNNEIFLLKMFVPSCLSSKKKTTSRNHSKVSRMSSFDGYEKPIDKERWSISHLVSRKNRSNSSGSSSSSCSSGSTGCNTSSKNRNVDDNFTPSCWTSNNLCKPRGQRGCLF